MSQRLDTSLNAQAVPGKGGDKKKLAGGEGESDGKERKIFGDKSNNNANTNAITGGASNGGGMWDSKAEGGGGGDGGGGGVVHGNAVEVINALVRCWCKTIGRS